MQILVKKLMFNDLKLNVVPLEEIAEVRAGISTGDNNYYLYKEKDALGPYKIIDEKNVITYVEIKKIVENTELRAQIIKKGISKKMFGGKTILPYDKGGSSDIESGRLSNYFVPTKFYIDWSEKNLDRMKTLTIADRKRAYGLKNIPKSDEGKLAFIYPNKEFFFQKGITFSGVGLYSPTYRLSSSTLFEQKAGSGIFIKKKWENYISYEFLLGMVCSKLVRYIQRSFINNTVNFFVTDVRKTPICLCNKLLKNKIENLVKSIIKKQKKDPDYNYQDHEQIEIDKLVYEIFGLDQELIDEVETWYARRYPKLVRN